jgi:hypothetical protein
LDRLYLPPIGNDILQGDIIDDVPSVFVRPGPLRVARFHKDLGHHLLWSIHTDANPPKDGMKLSMDLEGEELLVHGYRGLAMMLTHECEIENDDRARTVAMIRPASQLNPETVAQLFSGSIDEAYYSRFPLEAQEEHPTMERSFVDFMRLTTVDPKVLDECRRVASLPDELKHAVAARFKDFLFRRVA